jgi:uncharacterized protein HemX
MPEQSKERGRRGTSGTFISVGGSGKYVSFSLVTVVGAAIATAIAIYIHLAVQARSEAKEAVLHHEHKRIDAAHVDAPKVFVNHREHEKLEHNTRAIQKEITEIKEQQKEAIEQQKEVADKINSLRYLLRRSGRIE